MADRVPLVEVFEHGRTTYAECECGWSISEPFGPMLARRILTHVREEHGGSEHVIDVRTDYGRFLCDAPAGADA
jgi:hypothetical protein